MSALSQHVCLSVDDCPYEDECRCRRLDKTPRERAVAGDIVEPGAAPISLVGAPAGARAAQSGKVKRFKFVGEPCANRAKRPEAWLLLDAADCFHIIAHGMKRHVENRQRQVERECGEWL